VKALVLVALQVERGHARVVGIVEPFLHRQAPQGHRRHAAEQRVNEEMNGTMCMEVFPNSTLYNDDKVLEAMLQGDVQLAAPSLSKFEKFTKQFRIFDLPFMFKDINAVDALPGLRPVRR
jgi:TRAP-type C4-dicarboxylate transport system substrate-binding protein